MTEALVALVKRAEGLRRTAYLCPAGYPTIGYGHRIPRLTIDPITEQEADAILRADLDEAERHALVLAPELKGEPARLAALTDLIFNVGAGPLIGSGLVTLLRAKDWPAAAERFRLWDKAHVNGKLIALPGLTARRAVGAAWILNGG